jgi:hypothetical protein
MSDDQFTKLFKYSNEVKLVMGHQMERLDTWVHQLADKIGVTLLVCRVARSNVSYMYD